MTWQFSDEKLELIMGNLLRIGVMIAALVVFAGGCIYLLHQGHPRPDYRNFHGEPASLRTVQGIAEEAAAMHSAGIIQLGLLLLIATPVMRVVFAVVGFALERDYLYTIVSVIVLGVLMYSFLGHSM
ncbi:MAG: DUF1634 domain-containing protein [Terriglobales bacterium]